VTPAQACIQFALAGPGVVSVLLNSSRPDRVTENIASVQRKVPDTFWASMKEEGLIADDYPHLGATA
jgi:D-threo-aldose 1-dehydrogenase